MEKETMGAAAKPDSFWRKVYLGVIVTTFIVVTALWAFSRYFAEAA